MVGLIEEHLKRGKRIDEKFLNEIFSWVNKLLTISPYNIPPYVLILIISLP